MAPGVLALALLLLLPGLLVARAPWPAVPFLSLSFWAVSWGWLFGASRQRFLHAALLSFALLALVRLLKPLRWPLRGRPAALVVAAAALPLLAASSWSVCPGAEMSFHSLGARLLVWRDGLPLTYEPLLSVRPFGAHAPALPALAADLALLSGLPPAKAVLVVHQAALGLLLLAFHALLVRRLEPAVAAVSAVLAVAAARAPAAFAAFGDGGPVLALAFVVAAAAWLGPTGSRSSAVAAGTFLGAAALAQPVLAAAALLALTLRLRPGRAEEGWPRLALAAALGAVLAAPLLPRLGRAISTAEALSVLPGWAALAPAVAALAVAAALPMVVRRLWPPRRPLAVLGLAALAAAAAGSARREWLDRASELRPRPAQEGAFDRLPAVTRAVDTVCIEPGGPGLWIPALAGRAVSHPWVPAVYRDELAARAPVTCVPAFQNPRAKLNRCRDIL